MPAPLEYSKNWMGSLPMSKVKHSFAMVSPIRQSPNRLGFLSPDQAAAEVPRRFRLLCIFDRCARGVADP
jgi:hypothetical protein